LKKVDLTVNKLESIDRNALRLPTEILSQPSILLVSKLKTFFLFVLDFAEIS
jgi:hypothetical protein